MNIWWSVTSLYMTSLRILTKLMRLCGLYQVRHENTCNNNVLVVWQSLLNNYLTNLLPPKILYWFRSHLELQNTEFLLIFMMIALFPQFIFTEIHSDLEKIEKPKMFILISTVMTWAKSKPLDPVSSLIIARVLGPQFKQYMNILSTIWTIYSSFLRMIQKFPSLRMITGGGNHILILKNTSALRRQWSNLGKQYVFFLIFVHCKRGWYFLSY